MTEKNNFEKGSSNLSNKKTKKGNSWKHQMYELEIAIAKESNNKKRDEDGERDIRVADNVPIDGMRYGNESL